MKLTSIFFFLFSLLHVHAGPKTYVILDSYDVKETHSIFFDSLEARGHQLTYTTPDEEGNSLGKYGDFTYDNLILFAPTIEEFGEDISIETIVAFVDAGGNLLVAANEKVTEPIRELANECGIDYDEAETQVLDHINYDVSDTYGTHNLLVVEPSSACGAILSKPAAPVLYRGIGHATAEAPALLTKVLIGHEATYSHLPDEPVDEYPQFVGEDTTMVTAIQARSNSRLVFTGSLEMFSDAFANMPVKSAADGSKSYPVSGNEAFCRSLAIWNFQERGLLRASNLRHWKADAADEKNPTLYRVKDEIEFAIDVEEYDGLSKSWVPFKADNLQMEFRMLDPYYRISLKHDGKGHFSTKFTAPDVYGVFKFRVFYQQTGYSNLDIEQQVVVRPFRHNEFDRFIGVAFPYYATSFANMGAFFLLGIVFLYTKD